MIEAIVQILAGMLSDIGYHLSALNGKGPMIIKECGFRIYRKHNCSRSFICAVRCYDDAAYITYLPKLDYSKRDQDDGIYTIYYYNPDFCDSLLALVIKIESEHNCPAAMCCLPVNERALVSCAVHIREIANESQRSVY